MRFNPCYFAWLCCLTMSASAFGQEAELAPDAASTSTEAAPEEVASPSILRDRYYHRTWTVGIDSMKWDYRETVGGKRFMRDSGMLYGVQVGGKILQENDGAFDPLVLKGNLRYLTGDTNYDGSIGNKIREYTAPTRRKLNNDFYHPLL